VPDLEKITQT